MNPLNKDMLVKLTLLLLGIVLTLISVRHRTNLAPHSARVTLVLHNIDDGLPDTIQQRAEAAAQEMASHSAYAVEIKSVEVGK